MKMHCTVSSIRVHKSKKEYGISLMGHLFTGGISRGGIIVSSLLVRLDISFWGWYKE